MRVLAVVPARGGSKAVPRKNLRLLAGRSLLAHVADVARATTSLTRTVLSTDDEEISAVGGDVGLDVPFRRPAALATDTARSADVAVHALDCVEAQGDEAYDVVVLLEPTSPLRLATDIDDAVDLLARHSAVDAVVSVCKVDAPHPMKMQVVREGRLRPLFPDVWRDGLRRQDLPDVYELTGTVYAVRASALRRTLSFWGGRVAPLVIPRARAVNIDTGLDFVLAEALLTSRSTT